MKNIVDAGPIIALFELEANCQVFTVDREDFSLYRRQRKQLIPCVFPD